MTRVGRGDLPGVADWHRAADDYEAWIEPFTAEFARMAVRQAGGVSPGRRALDVGAGTGALAIELARAGAQVCAIDFAPAMVARLQDRLAQFDDRAEAHLMDGQALDFPAASFDFAGSLFGVILFPDWRKGLAEMARVLRPGGVAAIASWSDSRGSGPFIPLVDALQTRLPHVAHEMPAGLVALADAGRLQGALANAGFTSIQIVGATAAWRGASVEQTVALMPRLFGHIPAIAGLEGADWAELETAFAAELGRYRTPGGTVEIPTGANIAVCRR